VNMSESLCEYCGSQPVLFDGRWCCRGCRFRGLQELRLSPTEKQIAARAKRIREKWTDKERRQRTLIHNPPAEPQEIETHGMLDNLWRT